MTAAHRDAILAAFPEAAAKTHCIDPQGDVPDPIGGPPAGYESTAQRLHELVRSRFDELGLVAVR